MNLSPSCLNAEVEKLGIEYPYTTLNHELRETRIITLQPGEWEDSLRCDLSIISLNEGHHPYETLSYVWEGASGLGDIILNGQPHRVKRNLFLALKRLRKSNEARKIWADALCINQKNDEEKNYQVALMRDIYKSCERVCLWFGDYEDSEDHVRKAFQFLNELAEGKHFNDLSCYSAQSSRGIFDQGAFRAFECLMSSSWWERYWVVQEAILPPEAIVMFGQKSISWESFSKATAESARHVRTGCCAALWWKFETKEQIFMNKFSMEPIDVDESPSKVYKCLRCDYSFDVVELYKDLTINCLRKEGTLNVLRGQTSSNHRGPSWVYNWSSDIDEVAWKSEKLRILEKYSASSALQPTFSHNGDYLSLAEIRIDKVTWIGERCPEEGVTIHLGRAFQSWRNHCKSYYRNTKNPTKYPDDWIIPFYNTVTLAFKLSGHPDPDQKHDYLGYNDWQDLVEQGRGDEIYVNDKLFTFVSLMTLACYGLSMFLTETGYMGMGRPQIGDEVWVLLGGDVPFLLRPDPDSSCHFLVGPCYLHGIIKGEAMADLDKTTTVTLK